MAKQRLEVAAAAVAVPPMPIVGLMAPEGEPGAPVLVAPVAVETKRGELTVWDRAKAYYHTIFAAAVAVLTLVVSVLPTLDPTLALFDLDPKTRAIITGLGALAGTLLIRLKSNEVWKPAPAIPDPEAGR